METNEWKEKLMDDFCVMFERATQQDDTIDWVEKMETFISQNFIPISELKRWVEENEKEISNSIDKC